MKRLLLPLIAALALPVHSANLDQSMKNCIDQGKEECMGIMLGASACSLNKSDEVVYGKISTDKQVTKLMDFYEVMLKTYEIDEVKDLSNKGKYSLVVAQKAIDVYRRHCGDFSKGEIKVTRANVTKDVFGFEEYTASQICPFLAVRQGVVRTELRNKGKLSQSKYPNFFNECLKL